MVIVYKTFIYNFFKALKNEKKILSLVFLFFTFSVYAQTYLSEQNIIIETLTNGAECVYSIDLDGDGDNDILSASYEDDKIAWYENDGSGNFSSQKIITTLADGATSVYSIDLDGDGDNDILSASYEDDKIAW
ncbi:MAG: VCBS repeat-containing protein, partial [Chlorobi bacterium]|nr:VCBS repeat-containing protein [Chlorobiota bacterium]